MKNEDDILSSYFSVNDPLEESESLSDSSSSLFEGEIEKSTLRYNRYGQAQLTISGWLLCMELDIVALQFAIPGSEISLARRTERPEKTFEYPQLRGASMCGFIVLLTFNERSTILDEVHFIANLAHGLTVAGALALPETFIQNSADQFTNEQEQVAYPESKWGLRLDRPNAKAQATMPKNDPVPEPTVTPAVTQTNKKELLKEIAQTSATHRLKSFLSLENKIVFNRLEKPTVSILIVLHNKAEYTLDCLQALVQSTYKSFELIIIDNNSTDETNVLLEKVEGATIIRNAENLHFVKSINQNLQNCHGKYTLLLNNDAQITPAAIENAVNAFSKDKLIAAVGGRIIRADGLLQEAGCSIISNGGCYGYGVGLDPWDSRFLFMREVDFCSGTFLLLRTDIFNAAGGFDPRFEPAYFEEVDLQLRLGKAGYKIIYDPKVLVFHAEHGSSSTLEASKLQTKQRGTFIAIHKEDLSLYPNTIEAVTRSGRSIFDKRQRILIIDDDIPIAHLGTGLPRTKAIIEALTELNFDISYYPLKKNQLPWYQIQSSLPEKTEVLSNWGEENLLKLLIERQNFYNYIWISRPHNLEAWNRAVETRGLKINSKIIYDAESLFAERELDKLMLSSDLVLDRTQRDFVMNEELKLFSEFERIIMVSERDRKNLQEGIGKKSHVLSMALEATKVRKPFDERKNILFVGPLKDPTSANVHGIKWFIESVLPILSKSLPSDTKVSIIGEREKELFGDYSTNSQIEFLGAVENLDSHYQNAKVVIVPTHFSAGISLKALAGASHGVPLVTTTRIANELGWVPSSDLLSADSPALFADHITNLFRDKNLWENLSQNALKKIENDYSKSKFISTLKEILA